MNKDFAYDPVTALPECEASGEIAQIFADIRSTMNIPILTSIWRGLAGTERGLSQTWDNIKPMYHDNAPLVCLKNILNKISLPTPNLNADHLKINGLNTEDLKKIKNVLKAYNRSNGLNFVTMNALIGAPRAVAEVRCNRSGFEKLEKIVPLMEKDQIPNHTWSLVTTINSLGSALGKESHVATLWRHLAHWPLFLTVSYTALMPLELNSELYVLSNEIVEVAKAECQLIDTTCSHFDDLAYGVQSMIRGYANEPGQVARMIVLGNILEIWITEHFHL